MNTFTLTVGSGIASLFDPDELDSMPIAEGFGPTNDAALLDLISKITVPEEEGED